jgi:hypothetical protein
LSSNAVLIRGLDRNLYNKIVGKPIKREDVAPKVFCQEDYCTDIKVPGSITGNGRTLIIDHTTDNTLVTFRFAHAGVKMLAAEQAFELSGHRFAAGAFVIPNADRSVLDPSIRESA